MPASRRSYYLRQELVRLGDEFLLGEKLDYPKLRRPIFDLRSGK